MKIAVRRIPSTSQKRKRGAEPVLDQAGGADRDHEEEPDRQGQREGDRQAPHPAADLLLLALLVVGELGVGRDRQGPEADLQRLRERDNPADHRPAKHPVTLRPGDDRLRGDLDLALGVAHRHRPGGDAAHHHPLEHSLTADRSVAECDGVPVGHPPPTAVARQRCAWPRGDGSARPGRRCPRASACPCRRGGTASRSPHAARLGGARVELIPARAMDVRENVSGWISVFISLDSSAALDLRPRV